MPRNIAKVIFSQKNHQVLQGCRQFMLVLLLALPALAHAQFTYTTNNGTITITGYSGPGGDVTIPATIDGLPVTSVGGAAFYGNSSLTSASIPGGVISIGSDAFMRCSSLTSVSLPESVTDIGTYAFSDCGILTSVTIPYGVTNLGDFAFARCGITNITIPGSVRSLGVRIPTLHESDQRHDWRWSYQYRWLRL